MRSLFDSPTRSAVPHLDTRAEQTARSTSGATHLLPPEGIRTVQNTGSTPGPGNDQNLKQLFTAMDKLRDLYKTRHHRTADNSLLTLKPYREAEPPPRHTLDAHCNSAAGSISTRGAEAGNPRPDVPGSTTPQQKPEVTVDHTEMITSAVDRTFEAASKVTPPTTNASPLLSDTVKALGEAQALILDCMSYEADADLAEAAVNVAGAAELALVLATAKLGDLDEINNWVSYTDSLVFDTRLALANANRCFHHAPQALCGNRSGADEQQCNSLAEIARRAKIEASTVESQNARIQEIARRIQEHPQTPVQPSDLEAIRNAVGAATSASTKAGQAAQEAESLVKALPSPKTLRRRHIQNSQKGLCMQ